MTVGRPVRLTDAQRISLRPVWSPDGEWIAFLSVRGTDLGLWVMRADGSGQRRLAPAAGGGPRPPPVLPLIFPAAHDSVSPPRPVTGTTASHDTSPPPTPSSHV